LYGCEKCSLAYTEEHRLTILNLRFSQWWLRRVWSALTQLAAHFYWFLASTLKMKAICSAKMSGCLQTTQHCNQKTQRFQCLEDRVLRRMLGLLGEKITGLQQILLGWPNKEEWDCRNTLWFSGWQQDRFGNCFNYDSSSTMEFNTEILKGQKCLTGGRSYITCVVTSIPWDITSSVSMVSHPSAEPQEGRCMYLMPLHVWYQTKTSKSYTLWVNV
jgi:hypothetical protein